MGYRNLKIEKYWDFSIKDKQLVLKNDEKFSIPLEDINTIMIDDMSIKLSVYFLQIVAQYGIAVYVCNEKHIPNAVVLPMLCHSRHFKMLKNQINIGKPFQKRLWQQIVVRKILNQAKALEIAGKSKDSEELKKMVKEVQSGDKTHVEAKAAAFYFRRLYGEYFSRGQEHIINSALNYGYAIIRGIIARSIICYGFEPSIGLFHHSEQNSYNLADDIIEPFRSLVDIYVYQNYDFSEMEKGLSVEMKRGLYNIINYNMKINNEKQSVSNCVEKMIMSFSACLAGNRKDLILPELIPIEMHEYE